MEYGAETHLYDLLPGLRVDRCVRMADDIQEDGAAEDGPARRLRVAHDAVALVEDIDGREARPWDLVDVPETGHRGRGGGGRGGLDRWRSGTRGRTNQGGARKRRRGRVSRSILRQATWCARVRGGVERRPRAAGVCGGGRDECGVSAAGRENG